VWGPLLSSRRHLSYDDCLEDKRQNCQNHSVLCCVRQLCTMICRHIWAVLKDECRFRFITTRSELWKVLFLAPAVFAILFVYEMSWELLNGFVPNSHRRHAWSTTWTSLKVMVKGQGHQGQKRHFSALSAACVRFVFAKTSLASSFFVHFFGFSILCVFWFSLDYFVFCCLLLLC